MAKRALEAAWLWARLHAFASVVIAFGLLVILFLWISYLIPPDSRIASSETPLFTEVKGGPKKELIAKGWISTNRVYHGEKIRLWFSFENHSNSVSIVARPIEVQSSGFDWQQINITCLPATLLPNKTVVCESELVPLDVYGTHSVALVYGSRSDGGDEYRDSMTLGPIRITSSYMESTAAFFRRISNILKDLTLPLVIALVGLWFQKKQGERDQKLKAQENDRAYRQQVWTTILPRYRDYIERHYIPLTGAFRDLFDLWPKVNNARRTNEIETEFVYRFLILFRKMRFLRDEKGGVYFKNRDGEAIVANAWGLLATAAEANIPLDLKEKAMSELKPKTNYTEFLALYKGKYIESDFRPALFKWVDDKSTEGLENYVDLLEIIRGVMHFEANRPFSQYWYEANPGLTFKKQVSAFVYPEEPKTDVKALITSLNTYVQLAARTGPTV